MDTWFGMPPEPERSPEPIHGWRAWRLHRAEEGGGLRIAPTTPRAEWRPREPVHATCTGAHTREYLVYNPQLADQHRSPMPGCTCGIHALKDPARLARAGRWTAVVGPIAMWGRVIEHSKGYRAEFAYPARLRLVCSWCLWYGRLPGTPERVFELGGWLRPACVEHQRRPAAVGRSHAAADIEQELLQTYGVELQPAGGFRPLDERRAAGFLTRVLQRFDRAV